MQFELKQIQPMNDAERAAYRAAHPQAAQAMDAKLKAIRDGLVEEFGEAIAEGLMPLARLQAS